MLRVTSLKGIQKWIWTHKLQDLPTIKFQEILLKTDEQIIAGWSCICIF